MRLWVSATVASADEVPGGERCGCRGGRGSGGTMVNRAWWKKRGRKRGKDKRLGGKEAG